MKKFLVMALMISKALFGEIQEINQVKAIEGLVEHTMTNKDWLLLDIDFTLTEPEHPVLQINTIKRHKHLFIEELAKFTEEQREIVPILMVTQGPSKLTHPDLPEMIQKLKQKGVTVLGFTAADTSVIPDVGFLPDWRARELERLNIQFSQLVLQEMAFTEFQPFRGAFPLYQEGILYCNVKPSKGAVLSAFLDKIDQKPEKIYFVDDTLENLHSVEEELQKMGIPFLGIHLKRDSSESVEISVEEWRFIWDQILERAIKGITGCGQEQR